MNNVLLSFLNKRYVALTFPLKFNCFLNDLNVLFINLRVANCKLYKKCMLQLLLLAAFHCMTQNKFFSMLNRAWKSGLTVHEIIIKVHT